MKQIVCICLLALFVAACSGNPPAWWNPNERYGTVEGQPKKTVIKKAASKKNSVVQEQTIDSFEALSYEEEVIAPLPEEEEISAQVEDDIATQTEEFAAQEEAGALPRPSVLE